MFSMYFTSSDSNWGLQKSFLKIQKKKEAYNWLFRILFYVGWNKKKYTRSEWIRLLFYLRAILDRSLQSLPKEVKYIENFKLLQYIRIISCIMPNAKLTKFTEEKYRHKKKSLNIHFLHLILLQYQMWIYEKLFDKHFDTRDI